jgi:UrcA family protein
MRHTLLLAIAAATLVAPSPSLAQSDAPSVRVAYRDLDLSTASGRDGFERRLAAAVRRVCPVADGRDLAGLEVTRKCIAETQASVKPAVDTAVRTQAVTLASLTSVAPQLP